MLYEKAFTGNGEEIELLKEAGTRHFVTSWSSDGRFLLYHTENAPRTGYDVWVLPLEGERKPVLLLGDSFNEWAAQFSPDKHWIVYASPRPVPMRNSLSDRSSFRHRGSLRWGKASGSYPEAVEIGLCGALTPKSSSIAASRGPMGMLSWSRL